MAFTFMKTLAFKKKKPPQKLSKPNKKQTKKKRRIKIQHNSMKISQNHKNKQCFFFFQSMNNLRPSENLRDLYSAI